MLEQYRVHYHLDWHPFETWLYDSVPSSVVAYRMGQIVGVLLFTPPHQDITWLRMVALDAHAESADFADMMQVAVSIAEQKGINEVLALESDAWLGALLLANRFRQIDKIIHMKRPANTLFTQSTNAAIQVHDISPEDLADTLAVDHAAFGPYWQMQRDDLLSMSEGAGIFIGAIIDRQLVGYLLATVYHDTVHLTRLAILPTYQRQGIASTLIHQMVLRYPAMAVTVNTQHTNTNSQRLYEKLGFRLLSLNTPVWRRKVNE